MLDHQPERQECVSRVEDACFEERLGSVPGVELRMPASVPASLVHNILYQHLRMALLVQPFRRPGKPDCGKRACQDIRHLLHTARVLPTVVSITALALRMPADNLPLLR